MRLFAEKVKDSLKDVACLCVCVCVLVCYLHAAKALQIQMCFLFCPIHNLVYVQSVGDGYKIIFWGR